MSFLKNLTHKPNSSVREWNLEQISEALNGINRTDYIIATGDCDPTDDDLVEFYVKNNAEKFRNEKQLSLPPVETTPSHHDLEDETSETSSEIAPPK